MNKKDERIKKLFEKGLPEKTIAKKIGYDGAAITAGIERVREGLKRLGLKK